MRKAYEFKENTYTLNGFYDYLAKVEDGLSGDISVEVVSDPVADADLTDLNNDGYEMDVEVELQNSDGEVHEWFNGTLTATVATSDDGVVEDPEGDPWATLDFVNGKATMPLVMSGTWVNDETATVTLADSEEISLSGDLAETFVAFTVES